MKRVDAPILHLTRPKRLCQREENLFYLDVGTRDLHAFASHMQRPLPGCHAVLSVVKAFCWADR